MTVTVVLGLLASVAVFGWWRSSRRAALAERKLAEARGQTLLAHELGHAAARVARRLRNAA